MKKKNYNISTQLENTSSRLSEPSISYCGKVLNAPILTDDDFEDDYKDIPEDELKMKGMSFFGPATLEEACERIDKALAEYERTGEAWEAEEFLEELRRKYKC